MIMDERRLRKFFQFTEQDLLANQRGRFSEGQNKRLRQEAKAEQASARSSAAILFVIAAIGLAIGITIASIAPSMIGRILIFLLMGLLWPAAWAGKGIQILRAAYALQEPRLCQVNGRAHILRHADETYGMKVGEKEFDLEENPSGVIIEGDEYTVYYLEATEEILSVGYFVPSESK
jgi:hypothetical protein